MPFYLRSITSTFAFFWAVQACHSNSAPAGPRQIQNSPDSGSSSIEPDTQTQTVAPRQLHCFADDGTAAGTDINLSVVTNRASGVAPLPVFFDTQGTTATTTTRPFHELGYCWDFGDASAGTFATTGLSKGVAKGPVAAHVFEKPGTYAITVNARDTQGRVAAYGVQVVVQDPADVFPGENTVCLSTNSNFDGCPSGAKQVTGSTISTLQSSVASNRRLLLHSGQTFNDDGKGLDLSKAGPGLVGSFGTGDRPVITAKGPKDSYVFGIGNGSSDWRIMDLDVQGNGIESLLNISGKASQLLVLRVRATNVPTAFMASNGALKTAEDAIDNPAMVDCEFRSSGNAAGTIFGMARRWILMGNVLRNVPAENGQHVVRITWGDRGVISHNDFSDIQSNGGLLKLHARHAEDSSGNVVAWTSAMGYSERIVISHNVFNGGGGGTWLTGAAPQNAQFDERLRDIIWERNLYLPGPQAKLALELCGTDLTVRDNIFNRGTNSACISVDKSGQPLTPSVSVYNNTCYSDGTQAAALISFTPEAVASVYNNLVTSSKTPKVIDYGGGQISQGANLAVTPCYSSSSPTKGTDFQLCHESPAIDASDPTLASFWDFSGQPRPIDGDGDGTAQADIGATELNPQ